MGPEMEVFLQLNDDYIIKSLATVETDSIPDLIIQQPILEITVLHGSSQKDSLSLTYNPAETFLTCSCDNLASWD